MVDLSQRFVSTLVPSLISCLLIGCGGSTLPPADAENTSGPQAGTSENPPPPRPDTPASLGIPAPSDVGAAPPGSQCTSSGLCLRILVAPRADGASPGPEDQVDVHYTGWRKNGEMFDSSIPRGESITFPVGAVIEGWTEALQLMKEGGTYRIWIPAALAYGDAPEHPEAPAGQLTFDVELIQVFGAPPVPADVAAAPANATCTSSGLCYIILKDAVDSRRPGPEALVIADYTGWTKKGEQFDSSLTRGHPSKFPVDKVIPGWTEMLQLMGEGSKVRVWIDHCEGANG